MTKVLTVVGARPQFIKAAMVSRGLAAIAGLEEVMVHTGQHHDDNMSAIFFDDLGIQPPKVNLGISGGRHGQMTGRQLEGLEGVILSEQPDVVVVFGDTNSTLAGALAAAKLRVPLAHVEAGLRSFNREMPEELNRVLTDHSSSMLFAPTPAAVRNLLREGIDQGVHLVGDVMYDATLAFADRARPPKVGEIPVGDFVLCTLHRAENTDDGGRLAAIVDGLGESGCEIVWPVHPRTRKGIEAEAVSVPNNVHMIPPVGYLEMLWLQTKCRLVATDSGGLQKEAFFHGKGCVTLRSETEWVELVEAGCQVLVGADPAKISAALQQFHMPAKLATLYGDGQAAVRIADVLASALIHQSPARRLGAENAHMKRVAP